MTPYKDYMFLLRPSAIVAQQVRFFKGEAEKMVGSFPSSKTSAHISMVEYMRQKPFMMEPAIDAIAKRIEYLPAIMLHIKGFDFFVHGEDHMTMYACIEPTYQSDKWFDVLNKALWINKKTTPHIVIARNIFVDSFYKLWPYFKYIDYKERFEVTELTVLERETLTPHAKWQIHKELPFNKGASAPDHKQQGSLAG